MTTRIYLIRHGVTASNLEQRYMGRSEEPLSNDGRLQARRLALRLADTELAALYCSPLRRAQETAEIVAQPQALRPQMAADFTEIDLSRWQGLNAGEIAARDAEAWRTWCVDPARLRLPGIESFEELRQRVRRGIRALVKRHADSAVAVVTHDGVVRVAVLDSLETGLSLYRAIPTDNTGLTTLDFTPERTYLRALNDTGHLEHSLRHAAVGPGDR
ncbi:MAG: histidine phosphatase family protein [Acidobacteriota bacterium]|jgi:probable phosphoglycerate mutase